MIIAPYNDISRPAKVDYNQYDCCFSASIQLCSISSEPTPSCCVAVKVTIEFLIIVLCEYGMFSILRVWGTIKDLKLENT